MSAHRYWRIIGVSVQGPTLELTDCMLLVGGEVPSPAPTLTATIAPDFGTLSTLIDGVASDIVSWTAEVVRTSGFALVFDCGVSGIVEAPGLRLGGGSSATRFPKDLLIQFSVDGLTWTTYQEYVNLSYPGDFQLTQFTGVVRDPDFDSVTTLLAFDGANAATVFIDERAKTWTPFGAAQLSNSSAKFGGTSLYLDSNSSYLSAPASDGFNLSSGDFTIELNFNPISLSAGLRTIVGKDGVSGASYAQWDLSVNSAGKLVAFLGNGAGVSPTGSSVISTSTVLLNGWNHGAVVKFGSTVYLFLNGILDGTMTAPAMFDGGKAVLIGYQEGQPSSQFFHGYIANFRITKGVARYTADFSPPVAKFATGVDSSSQETLRTDPSSPRPLRFAPTLQLIAGADMDAFSAYPLDTLGYTAADVENGGTGRIYGTTKEKPNPSLPATPFSRRVLLLDERSQLIIRETWSDAATGAFEFRDLALGRPYTTLSYDHLRNYRAVIADNQLPELQA